MDPLGRNAEPLNSGQWYKPSTYYQILLVEPSAGKLKKRVNQHIYTSVLARKRGAGDSTQPQEASFDEFELDQETQKDLQDYPRKGHKSLLSSYLPSSGIIFPDGFINALLDAQSSKLEQTELGNFYESIHGILHGRKLSQLIAKTWSSYLQAKQTGDYEHFTAGNWDQIEDSNILEGLIAREIFLFAGGDSPDKPTPEDINIYNPLKPREEPSDEGARLLILPTSIAWKGIALSLLSSGQAYYLNQKENKYHQIAQPILSTGEIVLKYSLQSEWDIFEGQFKEIITNQKPPWMVFHVSIPYPPIPSAEQLDPEDIKKWAEAADEGGDFPFYKKEGGKFLVDVDYFRSPYPYIPLTTS
ncbi:MAG: hypothetical protein F6K14_02220 [Symploca sp. SIO2C1]|nr:hypothetical protein [Symploca sp. SIO2C1]